MEERWKQRKEDLKNAVTRLQEALYEKNATDIVIDGVLHRFEFSFELAWKTMKDYLEYMGIVEKIGSPREIIKSAFKAELIENGEGWIEMMLARNTLSHLYSEEESRKIYNQIKEKYITMLEELVRKI